VFHTRDVLKYGKGQLYYVHGSVCGAILDVIADNDMGTGPGLLKVDSASREAVAAQHQHTGAGAGGGGEEDGEDLD
jgi:hypothetical protein